VYMYVRVKRQTADQRIAELQALIALSQLLNPQTDHNTPVIGHGLVDIYNS